MYFVLPPLHQPLDLIGSVTRSVIGSISVVYYRLQIIVEKQTKDNVFSYKLSRLFSVLLCKSMQTSDENLEEQEDMVLLFFSRF